MMGNVVGSFREAESAEFDAVVETLATSPRLSKLMRYLGEKYFSDETDQLTEYNIATEVFGRSKTVFDATEDAIARVEAHRLRKRLKKFYETDGKNHAVQMSIPPGSYVPFFTLQALEVPPLSPPDPRETQNNGADLLLAPEDIPSENPAKAASRGFIIQLRRPRWFYLLLIAGLALAALGISSLSHFAVIHKSPVLGAKPAQSAASSQTASPDSPPLPIRLMAGYSGKPHMDNVGAVWEADRFFRGGESWSRPAAFIARTNDPVLFRNWRTGDFYYDIPLQPGVYELHLYFSTWLSMDEILSSFAVKINGEFVLRSFDVNVDAFGQNIADERIFRDVSPAQDGMLHLAFISGGGNEAPALNALEVLPGIPHKQLPIRVVTQPVSYTDHDGHFWHPDTYFMSGRMSAQLRPITGTPDPELWGGARFGHFSYAIPVDERDHYTVVLHFAEFYFGPSASGGGGTGSRVFRVMCNGVMLLDNFDIYKEAGSFHALTKTFYHLKPTAQGKLNLTFEPIVDGATVSGIEVLDESQ